MPRKKAHNSDVERGRLHGVIEVWRLKIVNCKYFCISYLGEIFERVQFVPFSLLSWLRSFHFVPYKYEMRGKSIWNIWTRINERQSWQILDAFNGPLPIVQCTAQKLQVQCSWDEHNSNTTQYRYESNICSSAHKQLDKLCLPNVSGIF